MPSSLKGRIALALVLGTLVLYSRCLFNVFLDYDDREYVTGNRAVQHGVDAESIRWAFTAFHASNWHPLSWLSHSLDWQLFGPDAAGHHFTSVLLHAANAWLVFLVLSRMTGAVWRSAAVAALFAVHPLHVESVAWVAERKDVLSTFFGLLALYSYARYAEQPTLFRYLAVGGLFALSLLAKPMLVTLPCILLLLDYWPLGRFAFAPPRLAELPPIRPRPLRWLVIEKLPLFALSVGSSIVTVLAQAERALVPLERLPFPARAANALQAYGIYLRKTLWPDDLAIFYPHGGTQTSWLAAGLIGVLLAAITIAAIRLRRRNPALIVGWLWFLGTLVPVIGLVQVGQQSLADRYTYFPLLGIFAAIAWLIPAPASAEARFRLALAAAIGLGACSLATWMDQGRWENEETIWQAALRTNEANAEAHFGLGTVLFNRGQMAEGAAHFERAAALDPHHAIALHNLGMARLLEGRTGEALELLRRSVAIAPRVPLYHNSLGLILLQQDQRGEARREFDEAIRLEPQAEYYFNRALTRDDAAEANADYKAGLERDPEWLERGMKMLRTLLAPPESRFRCPAQALIRARELAGLAGLTGAPSSDLLTALAVAYGETGQKQKAWEAARAAVEQAKRENNPALAEQLQRLAQRYE